MKVGYKLILFITFLMSMQAMALDCSGLDHVAYQDEYKECLRANIAIEAKKAGVDCVECLSEPKDESSNIVAALSALAEPIAYLGGTYMVAKYQHDSQKKWAEAYATGYTECTNRFNSYLNYNTASGANPISATEANAISQSCNGNSYSSYAGYGGYTSNLYGGYGNAYLANGYSSGFMNAYSGSAYDIGLSGSGMMGTSSYGTNAGSSAVFQTGVTAAFGF